MLQNIVSTTAKVLTGCILAIILTVFFCIATLFNVKIDPVIFGEVLTFAAAYAGIAYAAFKTKRETEIVVPPQVPAKDAAEQMTHAPTRVRDLKPPMPNRYDTGVRFPNRKITAVEDAPPPPVDSTRARILAEEDVEGAW